MRESHLQPSNSLTQSVIDAIAAWAVMEDGDNILEPLVLNMMQGYILQDSDKARLGDRNASDNEEVDSTEIIDREEPRCILAWALWKSS